MEAVEVRFGRGDKRRTLGWLYVSAAGFLQYHKAETTRLGNGGGVIVWKPWGLAGVRRDYLGRPRMIFADLVFWLSFAVSGVLFMVFVFPRLMGHD